MDDNVLLGMKVADHIDAPTGSDSRSVDVRDAGVHEPAVPGQVMAGELRDGDRGEQQHDGCAGSDCRASVSSGKCTAVM